MSFKSVWSDKLQVIRDLLPKGGASFGSPCIFCRWFSKVTVRKMCITVWTSVFLLSSINFALYQEEVFSLTLGRYIQVTWISLATFSSVLLQLFCFGRIFLVTQSINRRTSRGSKWSGSRSHITTSADGDFVKIAFLQVLFLAPGRHRFILSISIFKM